MDPIQTAQIALAILTFIQPRIVDKETDSEKVKRAKKVARSLLDMARLVLSFAIIANSS